MSTTKCRSIVPSIEITSESVILPPPWPTAWSVKLRASRILPSAARPKDHSPASSKGTFSSPRTYFKCSVIRSALKFFKLNCKHLDKTVIGSFWGSVVANKNFTWGGGSSSVFSKAAKLDFDNICISSIRYILKRPLEGAY